MTSRERIIAALNHRQPDRVPVDFGATPVSGITVGSVYRLRQDLGLSGFQERVKVIEPIQMLGEIQEDLREKMFADGVGIWGKWNRFGFPNDDWKPWTTFDGAQVLVPGLFNTEPDENGDILQYPGGGRSLAPSACMPKGGFYFDSIIRQHPIMEEELNPEDNLVDFTLIEEEQLELYKVQAEWYRENTDYAIYFIMPGTALGNVAAIPAPWLKDPRGIRDIEEWYISLVTRRDYIYEVFEGQTNIALENLVRVRESVGNNIDIMYLVGSDFGAQYGPLTSQEVFRDLFKPFFKQVCDWIHNNTMWKTMIHTCGGIRPLIDDIIEAGYDILNPIQTSCAGMDPQELKDEFGDRITFHGGGVDTQKTLPYGTPEEVYDEVRERIGILNKGGGYIFNTVHNIQPDVPVENIMAMLKALEDSF